MEQPIKIENKDQSAFAMCMFDNTSGATLIEYGLSKREYFAAKAMQATDLEAYADKYGNKWADEVAKDSVQMADALLRALEEK